MKSVVPDGAADEEGTIKKGNFNKSLNFCDSFIFHQYLIKK